MCSCVCTYVRMWMSVHVCVHVCMCACITCTILVTLYHRVPMFLDQSREAIELIMEKWQSIPVDQKYELAQYLIPEVRVMLELKSLPQLVDTQHMWKYSNDVVSKCAL